MTKTKTNRRPRVLVLEGLSSAGECVRRAGGDPIILSPRDIKGVDNALERDFDALLLTGGGDIDPREYGEKPHKKVYGVNETRDLVEFIALDVAREKGVPVLGICRGNQMIAVHAGGRLKQHVPGHSGTTHLVFSEPESTFRRTVGKAAMGTSLHHQCVLRHGSGMRVAGRARDGMIESIESRDGQVLGVQWHPEMDYERNESSREIFRWLILAAAKTAGLRVPKLQKAIVPLWKKRQKVHHTKSGHSAPMLPYRSSDKIMEMTDAEFEAWIHPTNAVALKHRPAGDRTKPRKRAPVKVSWLCPHCGMRFDKSEDREDHIAWLHEPISADELGQLHAEATLTQRGYQLEPPPGDPAWDRIDNEEDAS